MPSAPPGYAPLFSLHSTDGEALQRIRQEIETLDRNSHYGWGHSIDFGAFVKEGVLGSNYLTIVEKLDQLGWLKQDYSGATLADIGCYTGGISAILAARNPRIVYAVDELPSHLEQCNYIARLFQRKNITPILSSVYALGEHIEKTSLDMVLLSGVLYHMSDMLVGLYQLNQLIKPGGVLLIETNAVDDTKRSYANFGRYHGGMWWQPTSLCLQDMCAFMGYKDIEITFYTPGRCLVRAVKETENIPYRCGIHWPFESRMDQKQAVVNELIMAPARSSRARLMLLLRHTMQTLRKALRRG